MTPVLADTGFLIALFDPQQKRAGAAARYLQMHRHPLATVSATIVESCFFLTPAQKMAMLTWIRRGGIAVLEVPVNSYAQLEITLRKYADQDIGFADA